MAGLLSYTTLRRAAGYEVRRYDAVTVAKAPYDLWQAGLNKLTRYTRGENLAAEDVGTSTPVLLVLPKLSESKLSESKLSESKLSESKLSESGGAVAAAGRDEREATPIDTPLDKFMAMPLGASSASDTISAALATDEPTDDDGSVASDFANFVAFPEPMPSDSTRVERLSSQVVVVAPLQGDWAEEAAQQRARALEALAAADGLLIRGESVLVAQYNLNFESTLRMNEVMLVCEDHPWSETDDGDDDDEGGDG